MSTTLYTSCADVLALCQTHKDDLALLLDPEAGFAPRIRQICLDHLIDLEANAEASQDEIDALRMESNTWGLLQALVPTRKTDPEPRPTARQLLSENPYTPTSALAQAVMHASRTLSELVVVREWLHDTAPPPPRPEPTTGYWRFTQHRLMHALRTGNSGKAVDGIVKEMDPDAVAREGRALAADDANHEKALAQTLYAYVRAGKLDAAVELCREVHQPWRAASIRGALLFSWRAIATEPRDEDDEQEETALWQGNRWRNLWKTACTRAALDPHLPDTERALYAALAPSASTAGVLEAACRTWEDNMWAQVSILCEDKQTATVASLGGGFWEGGVPAVETALDLADGVDEEREEEAWRAEVEEALQALATVTVDDGLPADNAFHMSQLHIILDRTDALLDDFAVRLRDGLYDPTSSEYPTMTRFFAHLCLFLQMIDIQVSPLATETILEAYLQVLEAAGQLSAAHRISHRTRAPWTRTPTRTPHHQILPPPDDVGRVRRPAASVSRAPAWHGHLGRVPGCVWVDSGHDGDWRDVRRRGQRARVREHRNRRGQARRSWAGRGAGAGGCVRCVALTGTMMSYDRFEAVSRRYLTSSHGLFSYSSKHVRQSASVQGRRG